MRITIQAALLVLLSSFYGAASAQTAKEYLEISDSFYYQDKYDSALHYAWLAEPLVSDSTTRDSKEYAYYVGQFFSMNHEKLNNTDSAGYWYRFSLNMFETHNDTTSYQYGETLNNYGNLLNHQTYYADALPYLLKGMAVLEHYPDNLMGYLGCMNNLANNYNYTGVYSLALELYRRCLAEINRYPQLDSIPEKGILLQNMGTIHFKIANTKEAEQFFKRAYAAAQKAGDAVTYYEARNNLGLLYISQQLTPAAHKIFSDLYSDKLLSRHTGNNPNDALAEKHVQALSGYAVTNEIQGRYTVAEKLYREALAISHRLADPRGTLTADGNLAHLYSITRRWQDADSIYERLFAQPLGKSAYDHFSYLKVYIQYCENLVLLRQYSKALEKAKYIGDVLFADLQKNFAGMAEDDQLSYLAGFNNFKNLLLSIVAQQAPGSVAVDYAFNRLLQLKGMILAYQQRRLQSLRFSQDRELTALTQSWLSLKQQLNKSYSSETNKAKTDSLEQLARQRDQVIAVKTGIPWENFGDSLSQTISRLIPTGDVAVEFIRYQQTESLKYRYGAFVVRPGSPVVFIPLCTEAALRKCFLDPVSGKFSTQQQLRSGQLIAELVWQPIWKQVRDTGTVYYSPDGLLGYLSPEALLATGKKKQYILQERDLVQVSGIRSLLNPHFNNTSLQETAVLWGNIDCSEQAYEKPEAAFAFANKNTSGSTVPDDIKGPLKNGFVPFAKDELPAVREIMKAKKIPLLVYEKRTATEENFKKDATHFSGLLHISSHGFYATSPADTSAGQRYANRFAAQVNPLLRCGLVLNGGNRAWKGKSPLPNREDGILTGYEIAMMDLSKVNLVVLSACETGLGDIDAGSEGILGLQRAFRLAGAGKMIISLWNVNATATEELMTAFYKQLVTGKSPADALRSAKLEMLQKENLPYQWAGFVLVQ